MKIKSRDQLLKEYKKEHPFTYTDLESALHKYFKDRNWNFNKAVKKASKKVSIIENNRKYKTIRIIFYEYPMKTDRPRHTRFGHTFSPNAKANNDYLRKAIKVVNKSIKLINTPATIQIDAYMEMPKQVPPDEVLLYECKVLQVEDTPDYDNIGKCYTDMLKNNIVVDDDIFYSGTINKYYSVVPRVEITIRYIESHESDYVYKKLKTRKSIKELIAAGSVELKRLGD